MQIGIDSQQLWAERSGLRFYCWNLLRGFEQLRTPHRFVLLFNGEHKRAEIERIRYEFRSLPVKRFRLPGAPFNLRMRFGAFGRLDVFQYMTNLAFPIMPRRVNSFLIPDLTSVCVPDTHLQQTRSHWEQTFELARRHGDLIITFSEHTKSEVVRHLGIPPERIAAIPLAAAEHFAPVPNNDQTAAQLERWQLRWKRYILSVGVLEPRKNHILLLKAYRQLKERGLTDGLKLVFAGGKGWLYEPVLEMVAKLRLENDERVLGHVDPLSVLYSGATMMVYPSLYEGFGLPPLEAMACGTPVITSNVSSIPEVVGKAGITVDPNDADDLANAMARVMADKSLQDQMRTQGLERAASFSWGRTAAATVAAYELAHQQKVHG